MIGYHKHRFNCAHYAIGEMNRLHGTGIKISEGQEWQASFLPYLRNYFKPSKTPVNNCLVVMSQGDDSLHLGVYRDYSVHHNYKPFDCAGCVIISDMGTIRAEYKRVRFYVVNKKVS